MMIRRTRSSHLFTTALFCALVAIGEGLFDTGRFDVPDLQPSGHVSGRVSEAVAFPESPRRCLVRAAVFDPLPWPALSQTSAPAPPALGRTRLLRSPFYVVARSHLGTSEDATAGGREGDPAKRPA